MQNTKAGRLKNKNRVLMKPDSEEKHRFISTGTDWLKKQQKMAGKRQKQEVVRKSWHTGIIIYKIQQKTIKPKTQTMTFKVRHQQKKKLQKGLFSFLKPFSLYFMTVNSQLSREHTSAKAKQTPLFTSNCTT